MKAVILAAGEGLRLRPLTVTRPKVMLTIANKPILQYVVEALVRNRLKELVIVVGYKKERIMSYFEDGKKFGASIEYVEQDKQLGTAHAVAQASNYVEDKFLVIAGDNIIESETLAQLIKSKPPSLLITKSSLPSKYGAVITEGGKLKNIIEKSELKVSELVSTGAYIFSRDIFKAIKSSGSVDLTSTLQHLLRENTKISCVRTSTWYDAVYPWDLLRINSEILAKARITGLGGRVEKNVTIKGNVQIGKDTIIHSGCCVVGPVVIGAECEIGPNVCIFPSVSIGDNVTIESFSEIKNSIIMNDARVGSFTKLSSSVLGEGVALGSHFVNDVARSYVQLSDGFHETADLGVIIGDDTIIENSVSVEAGKLIGVGCKLGARKLITTNIPDKTVVV
ncbi:MAG: sugar phosphate nucleotidyltransferase [Candidatus Thermoplasmatota archaeon]|nr:sugar phosphate nucleotidyltransferase [Candidatus Thermoplasmatota archaeon]